MLATRLLSVFALYTSFTIGLHLTWDLRPNTPWNSDDSERADRSAISVITTESTFSGTLVKRSHPDIHKINTTIIHSSPIIHGAWNISNASIPFNWLCIALFDTTSTFSDNDTSDTDVRDYACMAQRDFALLYRESLRHNKRYMVVVIGLVVVTMFLLGTIVAAVGLLVWTDIKRKRLERAGVTYAPGGAFQAGEIGLWKEKE
jgi:hypothetical protein